jgi:hypothetical protein
VKIIVLAGNLLYHILHFLEVGYEPFHLTGDEGVLDELDEIVAEQQSSASHEVFG